MSGIFFKLEDGFCESVELFIRLVDVDLQVLRHFSGEKGIVVVGVSIRGGHGRAPGGFW